MREVKTGRTLRNLLLLLVLFQACGRSKNQKEPDIEENLQIAPALIAAVQSSQNDRSIDFREMFNFSWDSLLLIGPYEDVEHHEKKLGIEMSFLNRTGIGYREDAILLVFFKDGAVGNFAEIDRGVVCFDLNSFGSLPVVHAKSHFWLRLDPRNSPSEIWPPVISANPESTGR